MRLHWGCGPIVAKGWENSDRDDHGQQHVGDLLDGLPWGEGTFGYAVTNHALQIVPYPLLVLGLAELRRVLQRGGWLRILVPSLLGAVRAHARGDLGWFPIVDVAEESLDGKLCAYLTWYSTARSLFTAPWLVELCLRAGFASASASTPGCTFSGIPEIVELDSRDDESIVVEAQR